MDYKKAYEELQKEHINLQNHLEQIKETVKPSTYNLGDKFFDSIVIQLNKTLQADYTFIGKLTTKKRVETVSLCSNTKILNNFTYELANTPCNNVMGNNVCYYPEKASELFPNDILFQQMRIEGYIGIPLFSSKQKANGILVCLYKNPIPDPEILKSNLLLFASRAGAELEHREIYKKLDIAKKKLKTSNDEFHALNNKLQKQNRELQTTGQELHKSNEQLFKTNEFLINSEQESWIHSNRLSTLVENMPDGILIENSERKIKRVNQKFCKLFGIESPPHNLIESDCKQAIREAEKLFNDNIDFINRIDTILTNKQLVFNEELHLKDGRIFERDYLPIEVGEDKTENMWLYRDITKHKKNIEALRESEHKQQSIFRAAPTGIGMVKNRIIADVNPKICEITGYTKEELIGQNARILYPTKEEYDYVGKVKYRLIEEKGTGTIITKWKRKDGEILNILLSSTPIDLNDLSKGVTFTALDITERYQLEKALKQSKDQFELAMQATSDGLFDWNLITNEIYYSPGWKSMLGYKEHELKDDFSVWEQLTNPDDIEESWKRLKEHIEGKTDKFEMEFKMQHKNGEWVDILSRANAFFDESGKAFRVVGTHVNITERKKSELALTESDRKLKSLLDSTHFIAWEVDAATQKFTFMSSAIEGLSGFTTDEWVDFDFWAGTVHPEDREHAVNYCLAKTEEGVDHFFNYRIVTKQGQIKWVEDHVFLVQENGKTYLRGFFHDITETKRDQLKLQESETKYRHLFENMTSGFALHEIICNEKGKPCDYRFIEVNPAFEKLTGAKASLIVGKTVKEVMPNTENYWIQNYGMVAITGKPISFENYAKETDKHFNVYAFCPAPNQFAVVFYDITKRKHAERALIQSEARLKQLSDLTFEGILIHKKGIAQDVNASFVKMTGYDTNELIGKDLIEILAPTKYQEILYERAKQDVMTPYEFEIIRKDGKLIPVEISSSKIPNGQGEKVVSFRDITERRQMQQRITETRIKAEELERERYAKELHDGLGPILSTCKVYFRTLNEITDERKKLKHIERTNELLEDALRSIKEISNNLSPHILRNYGLTQATRAFINKLEDITGIDFIINANFESRLPDLIEFTLYRTLVELINNSIKYSKADKIDINFHLDNNNLRIRFSDNGDGFDYEKIKQKRTGFGLLNLEQRIKEVYGNYQYNSTPGKGVEVIISLNLKNHD